MVSCPMVSCTLEIVLSANHDKLYKDYVKGNLKEFQINWKNWEELALERAERIKRIWEGWKTFEAGHLEHEKLKLSLQRRFHQNLDENIVD